MNVRFALKSALLLVICGACGGGDGDGNPEVAGTLPEATVRVVRGESVTFSVEVTRADFEGVVDVIVENLPANVVAPAVTIPAASSTGTVVLEATSSAEHQGPVPFSIVVASADDPEVQTTLEATLIVAGQPGEPDQSFDSDGDRVADLTASNNDVVYSVAVDDSGRIIIAGVGVGSPDIGFVARLATDGSFDNSFGDDGVVTDINNGFPDTDVRALVLDGDGLVALVRGVDSGGPTVAGFLVRLDQDGAVDTSFANGGYSDEVEEFQLLVARTSGYVVLDSDGATALTSNGAIDSGFTLSASVGSIVAAAADGDGILLGENLEGPYTIRKLTASGEPDSGFAASGVLTAPLGAGQDRSLVIGFSVESDSIVAFAQGDTAGQFSSRSTLLRFSSAGVLDNGFGSSGVATVQGPDEYGNGRGGVVTTSGQIVLVTSQTDIAGDLVGTRVMRRLNRDGSIDADFGSGGMVSLDENSNPYIAIDEVAGRVVTVASTADGVLSVRRFWL